MFLSGSEQHKAALRLLAVSELINQAAGDALSGVLMVEAILKHMGWSIERWNEIYEDLPSRQLKASAIDHLSMFHAVSSLYSCFLFGLAYVIRFTK